MLTFFDLLKIYGISETKIRLVRHGNKEIEILDTFLDDIEKLTEYTAWQKSGKYGDAEYLAVFCPSRGTTSLFLGIWKIFGVTENKDLKQKHLDLLIKYKLPVEWFDSSNRYEIKLQKYMEDLKGRLVVEWGKSTLSWVQSKNKNVVQIKQKNTIGDFISYDDVLISYKNLKRLINDKDSNESWINALKTVNGIYLIKYNNDGRLYVGKANSENGILGRWENYAQNGDGGNKELIGLDPYAFEFSILEILPSTMSDEDVATRENRWKKCLGTKEFGLNAN